MGWNVSKLVVVFSVVELFVFKEMEKMIEEDLVMFGKFLNCNYGVIC